MFARRDGPLSDQGAVSSRDDRKACLPTDCLYRTHEPVNPIADLHGDRAPGAGAARGGCEERSAQLCAPLASA